MTTFIIVGYFISNIAFLAMAIANFLLVMKIVVKDTAAHYYLVSFAWFALSVAAFYPVFQFALWAMHGNPSEFIWGIIDSLFDCWRLS